MFIENVSMANFQEGLHKFSEGNTIAIQILHKPEVDPDVMFFDFFGNEIPDGNSGYLTPFPKSPFNFVEIYQFRINDVDDETGITDEEAKEIVKILVNAKEKRYNVIVHCAAGISRSGAVTEIGTMLGFDEPHKFRAPNILMKRKMMLELFKNNLIN